MSQQQPKRGRTRKKPRYRRQQQQHPKPVQEQNQPSPVQHEQQVQLQNHPLAVDVRWPLHHMVPSLGCEKMMVRVLYKGRREYGHLPAEERHAEIRQAAKKARMLFSQAISLRVNLMRYFDRQQPYKHRKFEKGMGLVDANTKELHVTAKKFEEVVSQYFQREHKMTRLQAWPEDQEFTEPSFSTEDDIKSFYGHLRIRETGTPDLIFHTPVRINGQWIHWIDCKLYFGYGLNAEHKGMPMTNLKKKCARYAENFGGKGAVLFMCGFNKALLSIVSPHATCLDASNIDLTELKGYYNPFLHQY